MRSAICLLGLALLPCVVAADVATPEAKPTSTRHPLAALLKGLRSGATEKRLRAAKALEELGPRAAPATKELIAALADPEEKVREHVKNALTEIGSPAFRSLARVVRNGDTQTRLLAMVVCGWIGQSWNYKAGTAVKDISPALIGCLSDKDPLIREAAIQCLGELQVVSSIPHLLKLLEKEKNLRVRCGAISACGFFGVAGKPAIPVLEKAVVAEYDKRLENCESPGSDAIIALAGIGEAGIPALTRILADGKVKRDIRHEVLSALRNMRYWKIPFAAAGPAICKALSDRDEDLRIKAALTLGQMESADKHVLAALVVATKDRSPYVRIFAASAIHRFDRQNKVVLPTLIDALDDREVGARRGACSALDDIGRQASGAIPKLIPLVGDANAGVRLAAINALSRMGPGSVAAIPAVTIATNDPNQNIRDAARECLKQIERSMRKP